jgi:capsular exopolysaccharide synthesis family protein
MQLNGTNGSHNHSKTVNTIDSDSENDIDLQKLFNLLLLRKWTIIAFTVLGGITAAVYSILEIPIYESRGTLMISQNQNRYSYAGSDLSSLLTTTYGIGVGSSIANELEILSSVTQSFKLAERIMEREFDENGRKYPILWVDYPNDSTTAEIASVASRYRRSITFDKVSPIADLISITFSSPSPNEAADIINLTMDSYSKLSTEQNRIMAVSALEFLREEKIRIEQELFNSEDQLRNFMTETDIVSINPQSQEIIKSLTSVETQIQDLRVRLVAVNSSIEQYKSQLDEIKPGIAEQYSDALGQKMLRFQFRLAELEDERLMLRVKNPDIDENNSEIVRLNNQIDQIKSEVTRITSQLMENESDLYLSFIDGGSVVGQIASLSSKLIELNVEKLQFETQLDILNRYSNDLNEEFDKLPDNIIDLSRLERNVRINEQLYLLVSNQLAEMSLWEKTQFGMGRTLDTALPPLNPVSPRKKLITLIGLIIGGVIGVSIVFIVDILDDKITSTDSFKEFNLPILGTIPDFSVLNSIDPTERQFVDNKSVSNQLITFLDHISPMSEAYRRLRINVVYANPDKHYKVLMVTTATKGEGKSTVAANLAVTFSEAEKSVLVIDLDLRRPTQHKIFGENREPGLTDSLFETVKLSDIIRSTIAPNVDLLTVGKKTPEPATVLDSKRLKQLIDRLKDRYDHIILDTAPYGIISDSASLLRLVDGIVVVSRFNVTTKKELAFTLDGLHHLNADILGFVFNAFNPEKSTDYYTNYAYYKRTYYSDYYKE